MIPTFVQTSLYSAVLALFSSGAPGAFLDANDWGPTGTGGTGVVFQDLSGTPVTAMEQPVQLILEKSQGLARGAERVTNGDLANGTTGWINSGSSTFAVTSFAGKSTALHIVAGSAGGAGTYQNITPVNKAYYITFDLYVVSGAVYGGVSTNKFKGGNFTTGAWTTVSGVYFSTDAAFRFYGVSIGDEFYVTNFSCKQIAGNHAHVSASANRPIITARYNLLLATAVLSTQSVTVGAGSYTLYFTGSGSVALSGAATGTKTAGSNVITCTAGTLTLTVTGSVLTADLRPSDQATGLIPQYQRVNTATDYDWSPAFPPMIRGNGSNQYLTGNLDLSSTNKVTVWSGFRKVSDATNYQIIAEFAYPTAGGFSFHGSGNGLAGGAFAAALQGATGAGSVSHGTAPAPATRVVNSKYDLSTTPITSQIVSQLNGAASSETILGSGPTGGGNFASGAYFLLSRGGTSLFSSGGFNTLIIVGKAANDSEILLGNQFCNQKIKAA